MENTIFESIYLESGNGSVITGIVNPDGELTIIGCKFILCETKGDDDDFGCGGAINIILMGNGKFNISGDEFFPTVFDRCSVPSSTSESKGDGGGVCIYSEDDGGFYSFNGRIQFSNCEAAHGKNIYINSNNLEIVISLSEFNYYYSLVLGE
jgi:hypothetical protein